MGVTININSEPLATYQIAKAYFKRSCNYIYKIPMEERNIVYNNIKPNSLAKDHSEAQTSIQTAAPPGIPPLPFSHLCQP